jgi:hypothetical protein
MQHVAFDRAHRLVLQVLEDLGKPRVVDEVAATATFVGGLGELYPVGGSSEHAVRANASVALNATEKAPREIIKLISHLC